jgi:hypothetical protein
MADTGQLDSETFDRLAEAVVALNPQPRERRWVSLSLCIVDAVWSIGANYDRVVVPLVRKLATKLGVEQLTVAVQEPIGVDPLPVSRLAELGLDVLTGLTNRQRTSTRHGILKADAVLRHAHVFIEHDATTLAEVIELLADEDRFAAVDAALRSIPGEGAHGIRRGYLWMLVGQDDLIKPDRMVSRWFRHYGVVVDPGGARDVIAKLVTAIGPRLGRDGTAWEIDHALWSAGRGLPAR